MNARSAVPALDPASRAECQRDKAKRLPEVIRLDVLGTPEAEELAPPGRSLKHRLHEGSADQSATLPFDDAQLVNDPAVIALEILIVSDAESDRLPHLILGDDDMAELQLPLKLGPGHPADLPGVRPLQAVNERKIVQCGRSNVNRHARRRQRLCSTLGGDEVHTSPQGYGSSRAANPTSGAPPSTALTPLPS